MMTFGVVEYKSKKMEDNKKLIVVGILAAAAAYYFYSQSEPYNNVRQYRLPNGTVVFATELPALGYTETPQGWVETVLFNSLQSKVSQGVDFSTALKSVQDAYGEIRDITGSNTLKFNGNQVDTNSPFSVPADWGLSEGGSILAGYRSRQVIMNQHDNVFNQIQF
jgi:hypothetical protein